jgi:hypothetical protein
VVLWITEVEKTTGETWKVEGGTLICKGPYQLSGPLDSFYLVGDPSERPQNVRAF